MKNNSAMNRTFIKPLFIVFLMMIWTAVPSPPLSADPSAVDNATAWLTANQNPFGSWGGTSSEELRTTLFVATALNTIQQKKTPYFDGMNFIDGQVIGNLDFLSRKIKLYAMHGEEVSSMVEDLLAAQNTVETDTYLWNYPEGGWGPLSGLSTNNLDTALALDAIDAAGLAGGLTVSNQVIGAGGTDQFQFEVPETATSLRIRFTSLSGTLEVRIRQGSAPTTSDPYFTLTAAPVILNGLDVNPGTNHIRIDSSAGATYSFEVSYTTDIIDTQNLLSPVNYLIQSQNSDGGWGLSKGSDSNLYITAHVILVLNTYNDYFGLQTSIEPAMIWLKNQQNSDNGFGDGASSAYETAMACLALFTVEPQSSEAQNALTFLLGLQESNGSWNDDSHDTALSVLALYASMQTTDTDGDGIPDHFDNCPGNANADQLNTDGDGLGDACDDDDDNDGLSDSYETSFWGSNPTSSDSDLDGISDGDEDWDFDGQTTSGELSTGADPVVPEIDLKPGLNLIGYPVEVPDAYTSYDLITDLGDDSDVEKIQRYDNETDSYDITFYNSGNPDGDQFPIVSGEGYMVFMKTAKTLSFTGEISCPSHLFLAGINLISVPCIPPGTTSYEILEHLGTNDSIASIQRYNPESGRFETTAFYDDLTSGSKFPILNGQGYLAYVRKNSITSSMLAPPSIWIASPVDGTITETPLVNVSGTVGANVGVTVNGVSAEVSGVDFIAENIPLIPGENTITATAVSANNLRGSTTISIILEQSVDYSIAKGGSVGDLRIIQADSALLDQTAYISESQIGIPVGIVYSTTGVSRISATELQVTFSIYVDPTATDGLVEFQVEYGLLDSTYNPLTPLTGNVFDLSIQVLP